MRFYRLLYDDANLALAAETPDGSLVDLTSIDPDLTEIEDLALASSLSGITIDGGPEPDRGRGRRFP